MIIAVDPDKFREWFPALADYTDELIASSYAGAGSYISLTAGEIGLPVALQTRGVYLATAHIAYLATNPNALRQLSSASEGSVSASFNTMSAKDYFQYYLQSTPYGLELLAILAQAQPPMPEKPTNIFPYYNALGLR